MTKPKVLFLCTGNSCRSQMAEGCARQLLGGQIEPYSAGIEAYGMNPNAIKVMAEAGVDIAGTGFEAREHTLRGAVRPGCHGMRSRG